MSDTAESRQASLFELVGIADSGVRWRVLRLLNLFRTIWSGLFAVLFYQDATSMFGSAHPVAYEITAFAYFAFAIAASFTIQARRPPLAAQVYTQLFVDLAALIILAHASGGQLSGLASLLFVVVAAGSILLSGRIAVLYAAIATIALLVEQFLAHLEGFTEPGAYTSAGITGFILLGTAVLGARVAKRYRESEALATRRGLDLQNLSLVNDHIIQNMKTGVVVIDNDGIIRQLNRPAARLLALPEGTRSARVTDSRKLQDIVDHWETHPDEAIPSVADGAGNVFLPRIQEIRGDRRNGLMLLLEDAQIAAEQVQQMKLAALGRLTGSIAHEIRNPIGAISHANQLLAEAELGDADRRFVEIIGKQTERVNEIVENVLQLGRREELHPELLELTGWLRDFVMEYCDTHGLPLDTVEIDGTVEDTMVRMDPGHLRQVLTNLLDNARMHAASGPEGGIAVLKVTNDPNRHQVWLDVVDFGPGVPDEIVNRIFEPFYTYSRSGTGLGLFIARELCECNHASLLYGQDGDGRSCFRITFQDEPSWLM